MLTTTLSQHLEKLRYFVAVADEGSIASAAQRFHLSQPTLSHSIKILEEALKTQLFVRSSLGVKLTPPGERLYAFARRMLLETEQVEHGLRISEDLERATITVGTKEPYAVSRWPHYMEHLSQVLPNLDLVVRISRSNEELMKLLKLEKIDIALMPNPSRDQEVVSYSIFNDSLHFYCSTKTILQNPMEKIRTLPIYLFQNALCGNNKTVGLVLKNSAKISRLARDVDSFPVAKSFVLKGLGTALLPTSFAEEEVQERKLTAFDFQDFDCRSFGSTAACLVLLEKNKKNIHLKSIRQALRQYHLRSSTLQAPSHNPLRSPLHSSPK